MARSGQGSAWPDFAGGVAFGSDVSCEFPHPEEFPSSPRVPYRLSPIRNSFVQPAGRIRIISCIHRIRLHADFEFHRPIRCTEPRALVRLAGCANRRLSRRSHLRQSRLLSGFLWARARPRSTERYFTAGRTACNGFLKLCTSGAKVVGDANHARQIRNYIAAISILWISGARIDD